MVLLIREAFRELGFGHDRIGEIIRMARNRFTGVLAPQASEDSFNLCKSSGLIKGKARYMRPQKLYGILLDRGVAGRVHRYRTVAPDAGLHQQCVSLPKTAYQACAVEGPMSFGEMSSTKQKPEWYTDGANDLARISGDIQLMHDCKACGDASMVAFAWLGHMCAAHALLIKNTDSEAWDFVLHHINDSAVVVCPATLRHVPGQADTVQYAGLDMAADQVVMVSILSAEDWVAMTFRWRSPASQRRTWPSAAGRLAHAVRAVVVGPPAPLLRVAAQHAFWELDAT